MRTLLIAIALVAGCSDPDPELVPSRVSAGDLGLRSGEPRDGGPTLFVGAPRPVDAAKPAPTDLGGPRADLPPAASELASAQSEPTAAAADLAPPPPSSCPCSYGDG